MLVYLTYCSAQKNFSKKALPAIQLYDSERISKVFELANNQNAKFLILSGKYGLVEAHQQINYYDHLLNQTEVESHAGLMASQIATKDISEIVFFSNSVQTDPNLLPYLRSIKRACEIANIPITIKAIVSK
jgi:hypothetical protein